MLDFSSNYMKLNNAARTFFLWQDQRYDVRSAPAEVFDAWVREYVEEIVNVDTQAWGIHNRWGIINELLKEGILVQVPEEGGSSATLQAKQAAAAAAGLGHLVEPPAGEGGSSAASSPAVGSSADDGEALAGSSAE